MSAQLREKQPAEVKRTPIRKPQTITGDYIKDRQQHHFLMFNVAPLLGTLLALALLWWFPHRRARNRAPRRDVGADDGRNESRAAQIFRPSSLQDQRAGRIGLAILGCMAAQGPVLSWVAVHRRHHEHSDAAGDPHSPNPALLAEGSRSTLRGLWHAHVGWLLNPEYPNPSYYAPDLVRDKTLAKINRYYGMWVGLGLLIPTVLGGVLTASWLGALLGFLWGGPVRMFLVDNCILSINSFSHIYGSRAFETGDNSRNNPWVALPTFGESWQNNHHAFAFSAKIGLKWWQIDFGYWIIWGLKTTGWIWDVKEPTTEMMQGKLISPS